uniref:Uncharacterized protein n=1 Tax=Anguilla anguilla TaxID=7936 RepID=A0A0E9XN83_ANGAN
MTKRCHFRQPPFNRADLLKTWVVVFVQGNSRPSASPFDLSDSVATPLL